MKKSLYLIFILSILLLLSSCIPLSNALFGPMGSIKIETYPSGASIWINDKDTNLKSPIVIENLKEGEHEVKLKYENIEYTEKIIIYSNQETYLYKELTQNTNLWKINVTPTVIYMQTGETRNIEKITASYLGVSSKEISFSSCKVSCDSDCIEISSSGKINGISKGGATVKISYTENGITKTCNLIVYVDILPVDEEPRLDRIEVVPDTMTLDIAETQSISIVTAIYTDSSSQLINLNECEFSSSNNSFAYVDQFGNITGISQGTANITVSYIEGVYTREDQVSVIVSSDEIDYRAFCVGVGNYINDDGVILKDLISPPYDADRIADRLDSCLFGGTLEKTFLNIDVLKDQDATKDAILQGISNSFTGADDNDISYFFFAGHGAYDQDNLKAYICPSDVNGVDNFISVDELESALSTISGTKVVILESCRSGGFIGKGRLSIAEKTNNSDFNNSIISHFITNTTKDLLTKKEYIVITSCTSEQSSVGYGYSMPHPDGNPFGVFGWAYCNGCGYDDGIYWADKNSDTRISLSEMQYHIVSFVGTLESVLGDIDQDVQIYPEYSNFNIYEY
jgi:uncharacterized protein YjdB